MTRWILRTHHRWELVRYLNEERTRYNYLGSLNYTGLCWHIVWPDYELDRNPNWDIKVQAKRVESGDR